MGTTTSSIVRLTVSDLVKEVDASSENIDQKIRSAKVKLSYTCDNKKCNFKEVIEEVINSAELKAIGVKQITENVIRTIDKNQNVLIPSNTRGYILEAINIPCVFLENKTHDNSNYYEVIDLHKIEKKIYFKDYMY